MHYKYTDSLFIESGFDGLFLDLNSFLFQPFFRRFAAVLGNNVVYRDPVFVRF